MVSNEGIITTFGTTGTLGNLDDTVDKMHSGLIKTLWNTATGSRVVSSGTLTQSSGVFTLATPVIYRSQGTKITLGTTASHGQATVTANSTSNDRYDLLFIDQSGNSGTGQLSIAVGTFNVNSPKVADLAKEDVPIAIIKVAAGAAASATHSFQVLMSTFDKDVLDDDEVTYAKIQNVSQTNVVLGRDTAGAGVIEEITPTNLRTMIDFDANAIAAIEGADLAKLTVDTTTLVVNATSYTDKVGIGTATPANPLHVKQTATTGGDAVYTARFQSAEGNVGITRYGGIHINNDNSSPTDGADWDTERWQISERDTNQFDIAHGSATNTNVAASDTILRILSTGKVGINKGSSDPSVELDVAGAITSSGTITGVVGALTTVNATDVNTSNITSTANQNLSYELIAHPATPIITGTKTVVYIHDIAPLGNTIALPSPTSGNILHIKNITAATITLTGTPIINMGDTTHPKITSANVITLTPFQHVTLQAVNDVLAPLVTGHMIISD